MKLSFSTKGWHGYLWEDFCKIATEQGTIIANVINIYFKK